MFHGGEVAGGPSWECAASKCKLCLCREPLLPEEHPRKTVDLARVHAHIVTGGQCLRLSTLYLKTQSKDGRKTLFIVLSLGKITKNYESKTEIVVHVC